MKAKIVQERPINRNKDDYGQYAFLHHVASSLTGEFVYFCRKRSNVVGKGSWEQEAMPVERFRSMVEHGNCVLTGENVFISTNTFANENGRISQNVHSFNSCYADIDYYKYKQFREKTAEEMAEIIIDAMKKINMPHPNIVVATGHGLQLWWKFQEAAEYGYRDVWIAVQNMIYKALSKFGADSAATDASRVFRVPGTINVKPGHKGEYPFARLLPTYASAKKFSSFKSLYNWAKTYNYNKHIFKLRESCPQFDSKTPFHILKRAVDSGEVFLGDYEPFIPYEKKDIQRATDEKRVIRRTLKDETPEEHAERCRVAALQVYSKRIVDITRLVDIRGGKIVNCRHRLLFYLEGFLRCARMKYDKRKEVIVGINNKFKDPLPPKDLEDILHGRGLCYTPSNQKLIDDLFITDKEQSILTTIIGANEKQVRRMLKNKHKMSREEYTELMLKQIIFYMSKGYTQTEIAEKLGVTSRTVRNYINKFGITNIVIEQCNDSDNRFDDESRNQNASKIAKSHKEDFALEDHKTTSGANKKRNKELKKKKKEEQQALRKAQSKQAEEYIIRMVKKLFDAPRKEAEEILILITKIALQKFKINSPEMGIKATIGKVLSPATSEQVLLLSSPRYSRPTCGKNDLKLGFPYILNAFPDETGLNLG